MKWKKGGRQSTNIEDRRNETPEEPDEFPEIPKGMKRVEFDPNDSKEMKVVLELGKHNINKTTPVPTPRPSKKPNSIYNSQVTPGEWSSKDKI